MRNLIPWLKSSFDSNPIYNFYDTRWFVLKRSVFYFSERRSSKGFVLARGFAVVKGDGGEFWTVICFKEWIGDIYYLFGGERPRLFRFV